MASVNKVILIGNLGRDPEVRTFPSGGRICNVRIATTERWTDRQSGEPRENTEWHSIIFNDRLADIVMNLFDLRPAAIIRRFGLRRPIYRQTAAYGHFGRTDIDLPWEREDCVGDLKQAAQKN